MDADTAHDGPRGRLELAMEKAWRHEALSNADLEAHFHRTFRGAGAHLVGASLVLGVVMTLLLDLPTSPVAISSVQRFVARRDAGDAPAAQEWRRHIQLSGQAPAGVDHAAEPTNPCKPIAELPDCDDLFWSMRGNDAAPTSYTVDGC